MFQRRLNIEVLAADGIATPCPVKGLDSFAMRNFTNDAAFDDTLPVTDGLLEAGHQVPLNKLAEALEDWLRRKRYLSADQMLRVTELPR